MSPPDKISKEASKLSDGEHRLRFWAIVQLCILIAISIVTILIGFLLKPSNPSVSSENSDAPLVDIIADRQGIDIYNISSVLQQGYGSYGPSSYSITGTVVVPHGKSVSIYIDIGGPQKVTLQQNGWRLTPADTGPSNQPNFHLQRTFTQGTSQLRLNLTLDNCNCATYASPYLEVTAASVESTTAVLPYSIPGIPAAGPPWPISLSFRQSEVRSLNNSPPSDLNILAAYPQTPMNLGIADWSWSNSANGTFTAIDIDANDNRDMRLFYAGLIFGIAGSAIIGSIQAFFTFKTTKTPDTN